jgi:hypothetical protein
MSLPNREEVEGLYAAVSPPPDERAKPGTRALRTLTEGKASSPGTVGRAVDYHLDRHTDTEEQSDAGLA